MPRLFVAIDMPDEIIDEIKFIQNSFRDNEFLIANFIKPKQLHLTLKFLGDIDERLIEKIKESLKNIQLNSFEVVFGSIGVFSEDFIRIIWVGFESNELYILKEKIDQALNWLENCNIKIKEFKAHVTIARVKSIKNYDKFKKLISGIKIPELKFIINSFILKKSVLSNQGATYSDIQKFYLMSGLVGGL